MGSEACRTNAGRALEGLKIDRHRAEDAPVLGVAASKLVMAATSSLIARPLRSAPDGRDEAR